MEEAYNSISLTCSELKKNILKIQKCKQGENQVVVKEISQIKEETLIIDGKLDKNNEMESKIKNLILENQSLEMTIQKLRHEQDELKKNATNKIITINNSQENEFNDIDERINHFQKINDELNVKIEDLKKIFESTNDSYQMLMKEKDLLIKSFHEKELKLKDINKSEELLKKEKESLLKCKFEKEGLIFLIHIQSNF